MQLHPENRSAGLVNPEETGIAAHSVFLCVVQKIKETGPVFRVNEVLDMMPAPLQNIRLQADQAEKLLVEADDVDVPVLQGIEGDRSENIVQHRVAVNTVIQEFPDVHLFMDRPAEPVEVNPVRILQELFELLARHGAVEIESLHIPAAHIRQIFHKFPGIHAFHDDRGGEGFGHIDNRFKDIDASLFLARTEMQELGVQLDHVHAGGAQHVQGGISAAEVIHHNPEAFFTQRPDCIPDLFGIVHIGGFCDFHFQKAGRQAVLFHQAGQALRDIKGEHIDPGNVDGDRNRRDSPVHDAPQPGTDAFPDIEIQVCHHAVFFQHRNEDRGGDEASILPAPAGEGFRPDDPAAGNPALGLKVERDLPAFHRVLKI